MGRRRAVLNLRDKRRAWALPDAAAAAITAAFPADWEVLDVRAPVSGRGDGGGISGEALAAVAGAEVWIGYGFPRPLLDAALRDAPGRMPLRWIHTAAAGVRSLLHPEIVGSDVLVTNSAGIHAEPIAETVIGAIHFFARGFDLAVRAQARSTWDKPPFEEEPGLLHELADAEVGIIGYGGIGRAVARRAQALGMRVTALRTAPQPDEDGVRMVHGVDGLDALLRACPYLVLALPSTATTHHLLDRQRIAKLRQDAVIVSVGRGDAVDETALASALAARALRGAALDVFEKEPLPASSPLWSLDNLLILPHVSATTPRFWERQTKLIVDNVERYLRGEPLRNVVDKTRGY